MLLSTRTSHLYSKINSNVVFTKKGIEVRAVIAFRPGSNFFRQVKHENVVSRLSFSYSIITRLEMMLGEAGIYSI